ncbi:MAG: family transcriptional regulator [Arthrobacter sp.]|nr:family transcriptional regulator [Arthrobacter sp.]
MAAILGSPAAARLGLCWPTSRFRRMVPVGHESPLSFSPTPKTHWGALRWNLSELRRVLGGKSVAGDPLQLALPPDWHCDVLAVMDSPGKGGIDAPKFDGQLLEGLSFDDCPVFDSWLEDQRHRLENCMQTLLYEAALAALAAGAADNAVELTTRVLRRDPFHADSHAVLVKALLSLGEYHRARAQVEKCRNLYRRELGLGLPMEVQRAYFDAGPGADPGLPANVATVRSYLHAAAASLSSGSVDRGLDQLRLAVQLAQRTSDGHLLAESLVALSGALIHQAGGRGAEVADLLHRALTSEAPSGVSRVAAAAYRELGYLSIQRGIPDRAASWLDQATRAAEGFPDEQAKILSIRGMAASDTAHYEDALTALTESCRLAAATGTVRQLAFSEALIGRVHLLRADLEQAAEVVNRALHLVDSEHWAAFEPFVDGVQGETCLAAGRLDEAAALIDRSWVMADLAGDHCYMAMAAGAKARLSVALGDQAAAESWLSRGLATTPWYLWYTARLLDIASEVAIETRSPRAEEYVARLSAMAGRSGLRELVVRAHSHRAMLGDAGAAEAIPWLAKDIDNPALNAFLAQRHQLAIS